MTRHAIAVASSCADCAELIGNPDETEPGSGWHMGIVHDAHVAELAASGWMVHDYPGEPSDVVCPHYHEAHWQGSDGYW